MKITMASARVNAGLKQSEVCKMMDISQNTLIDWEKGRISPRMNQLMEFCEICGCSIEDIDFEGEKS